MSKGGEREQEVENKCEIKIKAGALCSPSLLFITEGLSNSLCKRTSTIHFNI